MGLHVEAECMPAQSAASGRNRGVEAVLVCAGGAFKMVSCPHYLGEIVIYVGLLVIQRGAHLNSWLILAWVVRRLN